jgi:hypothetical protein
MYCVKLADHNVYWSSPGLTLDEAIQSRRNALARKPGLRLVVVDTKTGAVAWPKEVKRG